MSDEELIDLAHTILLRMAMRGGHDAYTGALLTKWLKAHEGRRTPRALDVANPPGKICEHGHYGACVECGTNNPPAANANRSAYPLQIKRSSKCHK